MQIDAVGVPCRLLRSGYRGLIRKSLSAKYRKIVSNFLLFVRFNISRKFCRPIAFRTGALRYIHFDVSNVLKTTVFNHFAIAEIIQTIIKTVM